MKKEIAIICKIILNYKIYNNKTNNNTDQQTIFKIHIKTMKYNFIFHFLGPSQNIVKTFIQLNDSIVKSIFPLHRIVNFKL